MGVANDENTPRNVTRGSVFLNNSKTILILVAFWVSVNIVATKGGNFYLGLWQQRMSFYMQMFYLVIKIIKYLL